MCLVCWGVRVQKCSTVHIYYVHEFHGATSSHVNLSHECHMTSPLSVGSRRTQSLLSSRSTKRLAKPDFWHLTRGQRSVPLLIHVHIHTVFNLSIVYSICIFLFCKGLLHCVQQFTCVCDHSIPLFRVVPHHASHLPTLTIHMCTDSGYCPLYTCACNLYVYVDTSTHIRVDRCWPY